MIPYANTTTHEEDEEEKSPYDYEKTKKVKWFDRIFLNRPSKVIIVVFLLALLAPALIYKYVFVSTGDWPPSDGHSFGSCLVPRSARLPCGAGYIPQSDCHAQCCYDLDNRFCFHRFPSRFSYIMDHVHQNWSEEVLLRPRISTVPFALQNSTTSLRLSIDEISPTHLSVTFYDAREMSIEGRRIENKEYNYRISFPELNVIVAGFNNATIFNTERGVLIASENIWEISFRLTEGMMIGLGELPLKEGDVKVIYNHDGGLSSLPLIYAHSNDSYHGLLIDVSTPTEVRVTGGNQILVRSIARSQLKFHLFLGPEPKDVMRDVMKLLDRKKQLEYWMLGAHICSEMTEDLDEAMDYLQSFIENATSIGLPYESHCGVQPIVFNTYNDAEHLTAVAEGATLLKSANKRFVPHLSPYIRYPEILKDTNSTDEDANEEVRLNNGANTILNFEDFLLRWNSTHVYKGFVDSIKEPIVFPDYGAVNEDFMAELWAFNVNTEVDGVVLVNNWPLDESVKDVEEMYMRLPYFNEHFEVAFNDTPQWDIIRPGPKEQPYFKEHNMYGSNFAAALEKITNVTPTWSTTQWMNADLIINRQNVRPSWTNFHNELIATALGGISGNWLWSSPICGDEETFDIDNQAHLCIKWYMASTYLPIIKIHSKSKARDPTAFEGTRRRLTITALENRLSLLPYFYTVLQEGPLLRPMFYQFPFNEELRESRSQFSVGDSLLIAPNLQPRQSNVHVRVPPGTWYEFWSGLKIQAAEGDMVTMSTTEADFLTFIRGGDIVVTQMDVSTTAESTRRNSPFTLVIATKSVNVTEEITNEVRLAEGKLYMTPNMTIHFSMNDTNLTVTTDNDDFSVLCGDEAKWANIVNELKIYGLDEADNNYDHHKQLKTAIDLCDLENGDIVLSI